MTILDQNHARSVVESDEQRPRMVKGDGSVVGERPLDRPGVKCVGAWPGLIVVEGKP